MLKLEVGKTYRSRAGATVRITKEGFGSFPFLGGDHFSYKADGHFLDNRNSEHDLICEVKVGPAVAVDTTTDAATPAKLGGLKFDDSKVRLDLLSTQWLNGVGAVLTFGAKKYAAHNWRNGIVLSRLTGAALRHLTAFNSGEDLDPETGLSHLHHASCCLMFMSELYATKKDEVDDRYKTVLEPIKAQENDAQASKE
jgi:hypothetical protein